MNARTDNNVTLTHADAKLVASILGEYATAEHEHARRTKSAAVRVHCQRNAATARDLATRITRELWTWSEVEA